MREPKLLVVFINIVGQVMTADDEMKKKEVILDMRKDKKISAFSVHKKLI